MREVEQTRGRGVERKKEKEEGAAMWGGSGVKKKRCENNFEQRAKWELMMLIDVTSEGETN